ncbi:Olfactory receptor 2A1/2A42 [Pteropus alecto]|uniref:Olfactory receptor 2A1/2A42 n=2 Tax=Pteropus alecto TaxID=9402 RepID=L5K0V4_PTEAL|nr:Olfactory receptor 2A1/2A42 [Pteropus alecto]
MYFFLSHLATVDIAYACNTVPQMLVNLLNPAKPISFAGCMTQTFLFLTFALTECLLLLMMSYDRYVAICHPLFCHVIMSWSVCISLVVISWACGSLLALVQMVLVAALPFCGPHEINHFFCELVSVLKLACADTRYMSPKSRHPEEQQKILFLFYIFFNSMLNPLIYSLRNAEVKGALRRALCKESHS